MGWLSWFGKPAKKLTKNYAIMATFSRHETTELDDRSDTFTKVEKALTTFRNVKACKRFVGSCVSEVLPVETIRTVSEPFPDPTILAKRRQTSKPSRLVEPSWLEVAYAKL